MNSNGLELIPEHMRDAARTAATSAFGSTPVTSVQAIPGGASGALTYKIGVDGRSYLLRMETRRSPLRNPHQYVCMRIAAEAGVAPPVRYADDSAGVAILDFVAQRPLRDYPGGPAGLAAALGKLAANLQATTPFPELADYRVIIERMLTRLRPAFSAALLEPHLKGFERIRQVYSWTPSTHVSSHNDPNPGNILFDGERLWLIDWETSFRNDPLTDIAILTQNHAATPELEDVLLRSWLGGPPDRLLRARLVLMRQMTRLYYAGILLIMSASASAPVIDLSAPTPAEFGTLIATGQLKAGAPETMLALGKMILAGFLTSLSAPDSEDALAVARTG